MLNNVTLKNFGPLDSLRWDNLAKINLVIGGNGCGKTFLLKALYTAIRTVEEHKRGNDRRSLTQILSDKLYWTFEVDKIGDLVYKGAEQKLSFRISFGEGLLKYKFGKDTNTHISDATINFTPRDSNSIFLPAKEVLTLHHAILKSREQDKVFGFDDTYLDLARALRLAPTKGKNYPEFSQSRKKLERIVRGRVELDQEGGRWLYKKGNQKFSIGATAEGVKKIAILDTLLGNRYLSTDSIVFFDEPEAALHPTAISELLDIVLLLSQRGVQFFLASHSYFVIKKLSLLAQQNNVNIPVLSFLDQDWECGDLLQGLPDNPIINESIRLYEEEVELALE